MAKKPKKAPAAEGEAGAEAPKSKKKLIVVAAAVVVALGGAGGFFLMKKGGTHAEASEAHGGGGHGGGHGEAHGSGHGGGNGEGKKVATFLELRDLIVGLTPEPGQPKAGFLKLKVMLELADARTEGEVKPLLPRVEDAFQTYMRELRASDLTGSAGLYRLREELLRRVNIAIHPAKAEAVLFKDVVVQ